MLVMKLPKTFSTDGKMLNVVLEIPTGNRHKYAFDPTMALITLRKVLPARCVSSIGEKKANP